MADNKENDQIWTPSRELRQRTNNVYRFKIRTFQDTLSRSNNVRVFNNKSTNSPNSNFSNSGLFEKGAVKHARRATESCGIQTEGQDHTNNREPTIESVDASISVLDLYVECGECKTRHQQLEKLKNENQQLIQQVEELRQSTRMLESKVQFLQTQLQSEADQYQRHYSQQQEKWQQAMEQLRQIIEKERQISLNKISSLESTISQLRLQTDIYLKAKEDLVAAEKQISLLDAELSLLREVNEKQRKLMGEKESSYHKNTSLLSLQLERVKETNSELQQAMESAKSTILALSQHSRTEANKQKRLMEEIIQENKSLRKRCLQQITDKNTLTPS